MMASNLSGGAWFDANQANFPNSSRVEDLAPPFREHSVEFISALEEAGATVHVTATRRDARRAALMQRSWDLAHGMLDPKHVPPIPGVDINWDHGSLAASKAAAQAMVNRFGIVFRPSLNSLHILGLAIDMNVTWAGTIQVTNKAGHKTPVGSPHNGADNTTLHAIGATYGVNKLLSDKPHWSSTGH
jgi:hypothetical protein